ncbi:hypothetical protein QTG54_003341 [Skeletonema marinoi]|uniref:Transmembrane protein 147 n=1 Tax=Skeletonema marinoi TaxID=267567 RepID=A0AAD8YHL2_9STRA|nr:hypothetical protein QTG54_003341 [Skeletonema marinoi]
MMAASLYMLLLQCVLLIFSSSAFQVAPSSLQRTASFGRQSSSDIRWYRQTTTLFADSNDDKDEQPPQLMDDDNNINDLFQRFLSPQIDDPGLPLTDVLLSQIVAPTFQLYWVFVAHAPLPSWARPISSYFGEATELAPRGSLLAPTLIHGAGLAVCWLAGALAAKSFERDAFTLTNNNYDDENGGSRLSIGEKIKQYDTVLLRLFQAGAFACGILIVSTQVDLLLEFKRYVQFGESDETDFRLFLAGVEVINDIFFEALVISSWRIIHANFMSTPMNRSRRF